LPLLFMISGMGVAFAFRKRNAIEFLGERTKRLILPLIFGVLVFVPPQIYVKLLFRGEDPGGYLETYPAFFNGFDPPGNFTPSHLWFLVVLFAFCLLALPLFLWFRSESGAKLLTRIHSICETRFGFYLAAIPIAAGIYLLTPISSGFWTDWQTFYVYLCMFILGFILASRAEFCGAMKKHRWTYLLLTFGMYIAYFGFYYLNRLQGIDLQLIPLFRVLAMLSLILAAFGFAQVYLNRPSKWLTYTNDAVYPYYIVQPTVIIVLSYIAVQWQASWLLKFAFIVIGSFSITGLFYHFVIRPWGLIRPLFGMKKWRK